jgi:hypothetical protein
MMTARKSMHENNSAPGLGVDRNGAPVIDPTKNVEDLVRSGEQRQAELREADQRFLDAQLQSMEKMQTFAREADMRLGTYARESSSRLEEALRGAESTRVNELAATRKEYENTIRDMLAKSVETTSTLVSTQLVQIQATFDKRVSQLEAYQFTQAGRSSVADPALSDALMSLANGQKLARDRSDETMTKMATALEALRTTQSVSGGSDSGKADSKAELRSNISIFVSIAAVVFLVLLHFIKAPI